MGRRVDLASLATDDVTTPPKQYRAAGGSRGGGVTELPLAELCPNPLNHRTGDDEDPDELERMAATIAEHGVLQPLVVCAAQAFLQSFPEQHEALGDARWVVLIGNRRFTAAQRAAAEWVPAVVNNDRAASMYEVMLVENSQRRDLAPLREAEAMAKALERDGSSRRELAKRVGRTHTYINQRLALLGLIPELRRALDTGKLTVERARGLGALDEAEQHTIAAAGPPYHRAGSGNGVSTRRITVPRSDPAGAARSIRAAYTGDQLAELIRLLTTDTNSDTNPASSS